jgi:hypothetical protein
VNLTTYFSNNWIALAPFAFSFSPSIVKILPNAVKNSGGDTIEIYGYGFGSDPSKVTVMIGGQAATFANPGLHKFVLFDSSRRQIFLTATDHVDVYDLSAQVFRNPIEPPPMSLHRMPPSGVLRSHPDRSQLIVANFGAQSVYLINPDGVANNGAKAPVGGVAGYLNSGPAMVAATSADTVFVGLSGEGTSTGGAMDA